MKQIHATWLAAFTLIAGFVLATLFTCNKEKEYGQIISVSAQRKTADSLNAVYKKVQAPLQQKVTEIKETSTIAKKRIATLKEAAVSDRLALDNLLESTGSDSIIQAVSEYAQSTDTLITVQQEQIQRLDSVVSLQDTMLTNDQAQISGLNKLLTTGFEQQQLLTDKNLGLQKEIRKVRTKNTFLKIGLLLVSGTAAALLLVN